MRAAVRAFETGDGEAVVALSLRAWAPVFVSLEGALAGSGVFAELYPDWQAAQRRAVVAACATLPTWVAEVDGAVAGFVALRFDPDAGIGEIHMVAVDPDHQRAGIGTLLASFALDRIRDAGLPVAMVETGGDPGHAPARRTYERAGFTPLPIVRYFRRP
jgi:ribosomal protein S18 acetylase RimI-like enzyme